MPRSLAIGLLVAMSTVAARPATADEGAAVRAQLEWTAPRACITRGALERQVSARLGRAAFAGEGAADAVVRGTVRRAAGGWVALLQLRRRDGAYVGSRELQLAGPDCAELEEPLALVLALLIDLPRDDVRLRVPARPPRSRGWGASMETSFVTSLGLLPSPAPGLRAAIAVEPPGLPRLEVAGLLLASERSGSHGSGVEIHARQLGVAGCTPAATTGRASLRGCAGVDLLALHGRGFGFDRNHERDRVMVAATARGSFALRLVGPLSGVATLEASVPFARPTFFATTSNGQMELHRPAAVVVSPSIGIAVTMGRE